MVRYRTKAFIENEIKLIINEINIKIKINIKFILSFIYERVIIFFSLDIYPLWINS